MECVTAHLQVTQEDAQISSAFIGVSLNLQKHGHLYEPIPNDEKLRINIVNELVDVREGNKILPNFGCEEINCYLDFICTS